MADRVQFVPIGKIKVLSRTREDFGDMESLISSIKDKGVIQPITLNSKLELKAGGRRYDAALQAGLKEIPALIRNNSDELDGLEIELIENIERLDFSWQEQARHIKKLQDHCASKNIKWSGRKLAELLDRNQKTTQRQLALGAALEHMPELAKLKTQDEAEKVIKKMQEEVIVGEMRRRQDLQQSNRGLRDTIKVAKANYRIGDCFKGMAKLKSGGMIHFIELDPPYANDFMEDRRFIGVKEYTEVPAAEYTKFMEKMAKETYRVANQHAWMICWHSPMHHHLVLSALTKAGWQVSDVPPIWVKLGTGGVTRAVEHNLANCYEGFFLCRKGKPVLVKHGRSNIFQFNVTPHHEKYHPTQRPVDLMLEILNTFCMPNQVCLIPCLGSGMTLRACYLFGMKGFGFDISNKYLDRFLLGVEEDLKRIDNDRDVPKGAIEFKK